MPIFSEEDQTRILGPLVKGMNNLLPDYAIPAGTARNIVNADVDNQGTARRRKGLTKVYSGIGITSGYSCPLGRFIVELTSLKKITSTAETVGTGIHGEYVAYGYNQGSLYLSDGLVSRKFNGTLFSQWGLPVPPQPRLVGTVGTLTVGDYIARYTYIDSAGVESGSSPLASISLDNNSGISFYQIPRSTDSRVVAVCIYLSMPNGQALYKIVQTAATTHTISYGRYDSGKLISTEFMAPAPAGRAIGFYKGRSYIADDSGLVQYSEPFAYDHFLPSSNYLIFTEPVNTIAPVSTGIFFATEKTTYFYQGTPEDGFDIREAKPYGSIRGNVSVNKKTENPVWMSTRGVVEGIYDGTINNYQIDNVATETADHSALLVREQDGIRQAIVSLRNPTTSVLTAKSFIDAEIIRRS